PLRLLPAGATVTGRELHPLKIATFARRTRGRESLRTLRVRKDSRPPIPPPTPYSASDPLFRLYSASGVKAVWYPSALNARTITVIFTLYSRICCRRRT